MSAASKCASASSKKTPEYSSAPAAGIEIARLPGTRFIAIEERKYPFRDALGRINLHLVNASLAEAEQDGAQPATCDRLRAWQRHAVRAINSRPDDERMTLDEMLLEDEVRKPPSAPATVSMRQRRLFRAPAPNDEPRTIFSDADDDESPLDADRLYLCRLAEEGAAKHRRRGDSSTRRRSSARLAAEAEADEGPSDGEAASTGTSAEDDLYEVAAILDEDEAGGKGFLIQWAGYSRAHDSWEPEWNLAPDLVAEFRKERTLARQHVGDDYMLGRKCMLWCASCRAHFAADSFSAQQRKRDAAGRSCLSHHYKATPAVPRSGVTGQALAHPASAPHGRTPTTPIRGAETPARASGNKRPRDSAERSPALASHAPPPPPAKAPRSVARALQHRQAALDLAGAPALFPSADDSA